MGPHGARADPAQDDDALQPLSKPLMDFEAWKMKCHGKMKMDLVQSITYVHLLWTVDGHFGVPLLNS